MGFDNPRRIEYNVPIISSKHIMTTTGAAIEHIHNLYVMQSQIIDLLDRDLSTPKARKEARANIREFQKLLRVADWRYMGGEDVLEALKSLSVELQRRLKSR